MKIVELLKLQAPVLKMLSRNGVFLDDWQYVEAWEQYRHMRRLGMKQRESVRQISEELHVSSRTLERAFKRLAKEC